MKVGIISDTHDRGGNVRKAVEVFGQRGVECVFHAGDMVSAGTASLFGQLDGVKQIAVHGNCDRDRGVLADVIRGVGGGIYERCFTGEVGGKRVYMIHRAGYVDGIASNGEYDLVIYGHTHRQDIRRVGGTLIVNPGAANSWFGGGAEVVILELDDMSVEKVGLK